MRALSALNAMFFCATVAEEGGAESGAVATRRKPPPGNGGAPMRSARSGGTGGTARTSSDGGAGGGASALVCALPHKLPVRSRELSRRVSRVLALPHQQAVVVGFEDGLVMLTRWPWQSVEEARDGECVLALHCAEVTGLASCGAEGGYVVSSAADGTVFVSAVVTDAATDNVRVLDVSPMVR